MTSDAPSDTASQPPATRPEFIGPPRTAHCHTCRQPLATPHQHAPGQARACPYPTDMPAPTVEVTAELYVVEEVRHCLTFTGPVPEWAAGDPAVLHTYLDLHEELYSELIPDGHPSLITRCLDMVDLTAPTTGLSHR